MDHLEIVKEGSGEKEDELGRHVTGCMKNEMENGGIAAIVVFEACVRTEE